MTAYIRELNLVELLKKKTFFLLGPRATGKTFLIDHQLKNLAIIIDLLHSDLYFKLSHSPWELENIIEAKFSEKKKKNCIIVIDEVQKIPNLLDEVHRLIESKKWRFLLTGSSARKLKYGHANLLAGRAWIAHLFPLVRHEIPNFQLERYLRYGGLPVVYASDDPEEELESYTRTYLYEEIQAEGLVRKLPQFSRFLQLAAINNGFLLNFSSVANDAGVPVSTVREYYSILEDTLLGFMLEPWSHSKKRKAISTAKFYLFDCGVTHALAGTKTLDRNSDLYGRSFEHWLGLELRSYLDYHRKRDVLGFWRSKHQHEVDFTIGDHIAIETKASKKITSHDLRGLYALQEEKIFKHYFLVSQDEVETKRGAIHCMYWKHFLDRLWNDELLK
ncbi:MAG: ATPase [Gammaproteobacteria bacterium RIFCSPLOWO2_02_FULL_38_11]|nr:MAG: ATPase [Gammaproteobacteria bacterium RIFCSPLOWO2_02_FULL_38_11]OGT76251.1 MAG: ATPase [Gammaproteobacteria bacterium RIFCSPLOWO2_12_FULL_38_14]